MKTSKNTNDETIPNIKKASPATSKNTKNKSNKKEKRFDTEICNSVLYMASLYKERSKCLVKLPTMQYTVTDTEKEDGEEG